MSFTEKLLDAILGTLPKAALALIPEHRKKQALERLQDLNPFAAIADNQDLLRVLRVAWIEAAEDVLDAGRNAARSPEWTNLQRANIERFHGLAVTQLRAIRDATFDRRPAVGTTAIDGHLPLVMRGAAETVSFGATDRDGDARAVTSSFASTLAVLVAGSDVGEVPSIFVRIATEGMAQPGGARRAFGDLVFASFAEILKNPKKYPQATTAFHMATQALARALAERTLAVLESIDSGLPAILEGLDTLNLLAGDAAKTMHRIEAGQQEQTAMLSELLALARREGVYERARAEGIPEAAVRAIVEQLGGECLGRDDLVPWLENWIEVARRELGRHSNEGEAFEAARREAERRFLAGRLKEASSAFMEEFAREEREEANRQKERRRRQVRLLEEAIRFDELALEGAEAAAKLRRMGVIKGAASPDALGRWLFDKAGEYYERGYRQGENAALLVAAAVYRAALLEYTRKRAPLQWAMTQNNLGNTLSILGERESGIGRLKEAVAAFRASLEERSRERAPLQWASTQTNLGAALSMLGSRETGTGRLEEAVAAYRAALEKRTREQAPLDWATTQNNLGGALFRLGSREAGTGRLQEAVAAFRAALEERTREQAPLEWAMTQNNLGTALAALGEREAGTGRLQEAVTAFRAALEERTRERAPLDWATTQNNLGNALAALGEREVETGQLEKAAAAYNAALKELTRQRAPIQWATTQNNLGGALFRLGSRETGTGRLQEAVTAYRAALEERTREQAPLEWATTQNNLGTALAVLGEREAGTGRLQEAVAAFRAALEERTRERAPLDWAMSVGNQGISLMRLAERRLDLTVALRAVTQLELAYDLFQDAKHVYAANYSAWLSEARELVGRLNGPADR